MKWNSFENCSLKILMSLKYLLVWNKVKLRIFFDYGPNQYTFHQTLNLNWLTLVFI